MWPETSIKKIVLKQLHRLLPYCFVYILVLCTYIIGVASIFLKQKRLPIKKFVGVFCSQRTMLSCSPGPVLRNYFWWRPGDHLWYQGSNPDLLHAWQGPIFLYYISGPPNGKHLRILSSIGQYRTAQSIVKGPWADRHPVILRQARFCVLVFCQVRWDFYSCSASGYLMFRAVRAYWLFQSIFPIQSGSCQPRMTLSPILGDKSGDALTVTSESGDECNPIWHRTIPIPSKRMAQ